MPVRLSLVILTVLIPSLLFIVSGARAQNTFEFIAGGPGEELCSGILLSKHQYHWTGHSTTLGAGSYDICIIRTDTNGNFLGNIIAGSFGEDIPLSGASNLYHEYALCGYTNSFSSEKPFVLKYDSAGNILWSKYFSVPGWAYDIVFNDLGDFYITGYESSGTTNVLLMKCDSSGNVIWSKSFGDSLISEGRRIALLEDGGVIVCGIKHVQGGGPTDLFVFRTDSAGNPVWSNRYASSDFFNWDLGYSLKIANNQIYVAGLSYNQSFNPNPNSPDGFVARIDLSGNVLSAHAYGSSDYEDIRDIEILQNGNILFTGAGNYQSHGETVLLATIADTAGNILMQQQFGGASFDHGLRVKAIRDDTYLIAGYTESFGNGQNDMYLIKTGFNSNSCNAITSSISSLSKSFTGNPVFNTNTLNTFSLNAGFTVTRQALAHGLLCTTTKVPEVKTGLPAFHITNPAQDRLSIEFTLERNSMIRFALYDLSGMEVYRSATFLSLSGENTFEIRMEGLDSGIYLCSLYGDDFVRTQKVICLPH